MGDIIVIIRIGQSGAKWPACGMAVATIGLFYSMNRALPAELGDFAKEPAFSWEYTSYCFWRLPSDASWNEAPEQAAFETGAEDFLGILASPAESYRQFASEYFEKEVAMEVIEHVINHQPVTPAIVESLNPEIGIDEIAKELEEIGFPR